jgi:dolichol-phosphate mannosyltransferase
VNPSVSIVVPTYNEQDNIKFLIFEINKYLNDIKHEIIVVDDGRDLTKQYASEMGARVIEGQALGLGQAIIDGIMTANNSVIVVMDADMSHHPKYLESMIEPIFKKGYDMTIGSRYVKGGNIIGWERSRQIISKVACKIALPITTIKDTTSGFFAIRKEILDGVELKGSSWKTMLEILVKAKPMKVMEVPITFEVRKFGKSKFNSKQVLAYLRHIGLLTLFKYNKFLKFCIVGGTGAVITWGLTWILTEAVGMWYMASLVIATFVAMTSNFILNNAWTFAIGKNMNDADYEWSSYYSGNFIQKWWKRKIVAAIKDLVPEELDDKKIIDLGCGSSPLAIEINAKNYIGIDDNWRKINYMTKKGLPFTYSHCDLSNGTFKQLVKIYGDNDIAMAIEVIEHMPDIEEANELVKNLNMAVKMNGEVIIATPNYDSKKWKMIEWLYGKLMPSAYAHDHSVQFNKENLIELCEGNNLSYQECIMVAGDADMICRFKKTGEIRGDRGT